jgi:hypothetical protein
VHVVRADMCCQQIPPAMYTDLLQRLKDHHAALRAKQIWALSHVPAYGCSAAWIRFW